MLLRFFTFLTFFLLLKGSCLGARVNIFLNIINPPPEEISFKLKKLYLLKEGERKLPLLQGKYVSSRLSFGQTLLTTQKIPPGTYKGLSLEISDVCLGEGHLSSPAEPVIINLPFRLRGKASLSLFILWYVRDSIQGSRFLPSFTGRLQGRPLREETLYVSCDDIDTLFAIRADTNQVVASLAVSGSPTDMAISTAGNRLYVLAQDDRAINVIELSSFRPIDSFFLPLATRPKYLALVGSRSAVITDPDSHFLLLVNLTSGGLLSSKRLGYQPSEVLYWEDKGQIFVSSPTDQVVYILNTDLSSGGKLTGIMDPRGLWIREKRLYVAEYRPGTLSIFNLDTGELVGRVRSGRGTIRVSGSDSRLYISNEEEGTVGIISPGQLTISKKIRVNGSPFTMATYNQRKWLYVADRKGKGLVVIDTISEKIVGRIELGGTPFALVVHH